MTDARRWMQAVLVTSPASIQPQRWGDIKADQFGSLYHALSDPVTGANIGTHTLDGDGVPAPFNSSLALSTAAILVAADPAANAFRQLRSQGNDVDNVAAAAFGHLSSVGFLYGFDGATWDRVRTFGVDVDNIANPTSGIVGTAAFMYASDAGAGNWDRVRTFSDQDALGAFNTLSFLSRNLAWNGAAYDRVRTASAATQSAATKTGVLAVALVGGWTANLAPAADTVAVATQAAGGAGVRNVCNAFSASITAVAAITAPLEVVVRDGATGVGTILWRERLTAPAGTTARVSKSGLALTGSANTAMTIEFLAAPGATNFETVAMSGYATA